MTNSRSIETFTTSAGAQIYRLQLEAFPGFLANIFFVMVDAYRVLIDCGSGHESSNAQLIAAFEQLSLATGAKVSPEDLTHIFITHGHIDHFGGLLFLREHSKAEIGVHELDWQTLERHEERLAIMSLRLEEFLTEAGVSVEDRRQMIAMYKFTKAIFHSIPVDFTYQSQGMKVGPFELVHIPGHCPGHVAIRLHDIVFCGDHLLKGITPHQAPERLVQYTGVGHYIESLTLFEKWAQGARLILSGHNDPIVDLSAGIEKIHRQLAARLLKALDILAEPLTISQVTAQLHNDVNGYFALLALEKTGAYFEYLYQRGMLEITNLNELESNNRPTAVKYRRLKNATSSDIFPKERAYVLV